MKRFLPVLILLFILVSSLPAVASQRGKVLGDTTTRVNFPAVATGPGLILPDSPFYFLDQFKQQLRLALSFTSLQKARAHADIAGERLAELSIMTTRNNKDGITEALNQLNREVALAAEELDEASSHGQRIEKEAKKINDVIKIQRLALKNVIDQTTGSLQMEFLATREGLRESKNQVEDHLSVDNLNNEIADNLKETVTERAEQAVTTAQRIEKDLEELESEAQLAAKRSLQNRVVALNRAIENKNEELRREQERLFLAEKKKQEGLLASQKRASENARTAARNIQEASNELQTSFNTVTLLKDTPLEAVSGASNSTTR